MRIAWISLGIGLLSAGMALADEQQTRIEVGGLFCPSCLYIAAQAMEKAPSVSVIAASVADDGTSAIYTVNYDDALTTPAKIAAQPTSYGYPATVVSGADAKSEAQG